MRVSILLFGIARDIIGKKTLEMEVNEACSVVELKGILLEKYPRFEALKYLGVAVNNEYAKNDTIICESDEIALIPPVSGG